MLYFAYGSNMLAPQMQQRCPGARFLGPGRLKHWRFTITTRGTANILQAEGAEVYGLLWKCTPAHLWRLDRFEGAHFGNYLQKVMRVQSLCDDRQVSARIYVSLARLYPGKGRVDYLNRAVLPGARAAGLPEPYLRELETWMPRKPIGLGDRNYRSRLRSLRSQGKN